MAQTNTKTRNPARTHEGAPAMAPKNALHELRRAVTACLLWEDNFYESGEEVAARIKRLAAQAPQTDVEALAIEVRLEHGLRHAPLWLLASLAAHGKTAHASTYEKVIRRADEMGELIAMHWGGPDRANGPALPNQMKVGIANAFLNFDEYQLAKYNRKVGVRLRDVIRLTHPAPRDEAQSDMWKRLIAGELKAPDTWEVALSGGADKKETFERLLKEGKLGYLALLRNLRNMSETGVDEALVKDAIVARKGARGVLPFQFLTAARYAPRFEDALDLAVQANVLDSPKLPGLTVVCVDTSASMGVPISQKSVVTRAEVAAILGCMVNGNVRLLQFASTVEELPARKGIVGADTIRRAMGSVGHGTDIGAALQYASRFAPDRIIVVSDMQSATFASRTGADRVYALNVAPYQNAVQFGDKVIEINGFSDNTLRFIREVEGL